MTKNKKLWIIIAGAVTLVLLLIYFYTANYSRFPNKEATYNDTLNIVETNPVELLYKLPKDSFIIESGKVRNNQFLADILLNSGMDYPHIDELVKTCSPVFDFRKMKVGNYYSFFFSTDSTRSLRYFIYEIDNTDYVKISIGDSIAAYIEHKEVTKVDKTASGIIKSSLWLTIKENNISPMLAVELSEIFAWTVDFFGIERGDYFKVIYTENYVGDKSIGIGKVHGAVFSHHKKLFYAFNFEEDSTWQFFDENGQSLRKAFLKAPLRFSRISSKFSNSRLHPILKIRRPHHGIDYAAPSGTHVYTIGDGRVIARGWDSGGGGNYVKIKHNSIYTTVYMHLSGFAKGLSVGDNVKQGDLIGFVGSTGHATGPHLDFRVSKGGSMVDPLKIESPPVEPVKPEHMVDFGRFIAPLKKQLDEMAI